MTISDYNVDIRQNYHLSSQYQLSQIDQDFYQKGYRISSWTQNADGSGRQYSLEETLQAAEVSADLDFYAQWEYIKTGIVMTATNGNKCYFEASDPQILSNLGYTAGRVVRYPYNLCSDISAFNTVACVECNEITSIDVESFYKCSNLTSIDCPNVQIIDELAFGDCSKLSSVSLPAATTIVAGAFCNCRELISVDIPVATTIGYQAFADSSKLSIINLSSVPYVPTIQADSFDIEQKLTAIVPSALVDDFRTKTNWSYYYATGNLTLNLPHPTTGGYWRGEIGGLPVTYSQFWGDESYGWTVHTDIDYDIEYSDGVWTIENTATITGNGTETHLEQRATHIEWTPNDPF